MQNQEWTEKVETAAFNEYIGFGRQSVPVLFRGRAWQMIDMGETFCLARVDGWDGNYPDLLPCVREQPPHGAGTSVPLMQTKRWERMLRARTCFTLAKSDMTEVTVSGEYSDYLTLQSPVLRIRRQTAGKGRDSRGRFQETVLRVFGGINRFVLRDFLKGIGGEVTFEGGSTAREPRPVPPESARKAMIRYFNRLTVRVNRRMWALSVLSYLLLTVGAVPGMLAGRLLMGIGALLPPVILGQYLVRHRLMEYESAGSRKDGRRQIGFLPKFAIPAATAVFVSLMSGCPVLDMALFVGVGLGIGAVMLAALLIFAPECRRASVIVMSVLLFFWFGLPAADLINAAWPLVPEQTYTVTAERKTVPNRYDTDEKKTYIGVTLHNGEEVELPLTRGAWNHALTPGETAVTVREYRGLLGFRCASVEPAEQD